MKFSFVGVAVLCGAAVACGDAESFENQYFQNLRGEAAQTENGDELCEGEFDGCGVCNGDNACMKEDCAGEIGGAATEDLCGICDSDPSNNCMDEGTTLSIDEGSTFGMRPMFWMDTEFTSNDGIIIGVAQDASGSHSGTPDGSETPGIDNPWKFFFNTGMHKTTSPVTYNSDGTLDMHGWAVLWNGREIPMHGDPENFSKDTGVAYLTCFVDEGRNEEAPCLDDHYYELEYHAHVPVGDASNFGGVHYRLQLHGKITGAESASTETAEVATEDVAEDVIEDTTEDFFGDEEIE